MKMSTHWFARLCDDLNRVALAMAEGASALVPVAPPRAVTGAPVPPASVAGEDAACAAPTACSC